jgi:hypothetical protein
VKPETAVSTGAVVDVVEVVVVVEVEVVVEGPVVVVVVVEVDVDGAPRPVVIVVSGGRPAAIHSASVGAAFKLAWGSTALGVRLCPAPADT